MTAPGSGPYGRKGESVDCPVCEAPVGSHCLTVRPVYRPVGQALRTSHFDRQMAERVLDAIAPPSASARTES